MYKIQWFNIFGVFCICMAYPHVTAATAPLLNITISSDNVTCVVMTTRIQLDIPYLSGSQNITAHVQIPSNATVSGSCNNSHDTNIISINFLSNFNLTLLIRKVANVSYHWDSVTLKYQLDNTQFPNASSVGTSVSQKTLLSNDTNELKVSMSSSRSYQCTGQRSVVLHGGVTMTTTDLHYRAFGSTDDSGFNSEDVQNCDVTSGKKADTDLGLAVTVGIALAVFIVVVILIYIIGSRIKGKDEN